MIRGTRDNSLKAPMLIVQFIWNVFLFCYRIPQDSCLLSSHFRSAKFSGAICTVHVALLVAIFGHSLVLLVLGNSQTQIKHQVCNRLIGGRM